MDLKQIGEFGWIDRIRNTVAVEDARVLRAIGDDAAVFRCDSDYRMLLTTDMLVERIHFERSTTPAADLGHKAMAANLSDIAAMGGEPLHAYVSLGIPPDCNLHFLDPLYAGMQQLADRFDVGILGGDTTGSKVDLVINIALTGRVADNRILYRNAARPGDRIFCTGWLGESRAGLYLLRNDIRAEARELATLRSAHLRPQPQIDEGRFLAACDGVHAAIDISDGLSSDLRHIARESRVGARIFADRVPISPSLDIFCRRYGFDTLEMALRGGEDFVLLGTTAASAADTVARGFQETFRRPLHWIGEITDSSENLEFIDRSGKTHALASTGWDHFNPAVP